MKNSILVILILILSLETISAQSIDFNLVSPVPQLQGTDIGDMEFADIDNDGDSDLLLTGSSLSGINTTLYGNDGNGNFTVITTFSGIQASTVGFNDIDSDGDFMDTSIQIYSQIGELVYSTNMMNELEQIELDVPNGVYIVTIQSGKDSFSQKLIIQK